MKIHIALFLVILFAASALAQQSDFQVKQSFEARVAEVKRALDKATTVAEVDSLRDVIAALEVEYAGHKTFLDKSLYPLTFSETMDEVKERHILTYDRVYLIETQGIRLSDLESQIAALSARLDSLSADRDKLYAELQASKRTQAQMRDIVRRLTANLEAKDRLLFTLVDSIFLPYGGEASQIAEVHNEAIGRKLQQANVVDRVYDVASDNIRFLEKTQMQPKDYARLIDLERQFANRWQGLRERMVAVAASPSTASGTGKAAPAKGGKGGVTTPPPPAPGAAVDSILGAWNAKLYTAFWGEIMKEFTSRNVPIQPFDGPQNFSQSIRAYVATLKTSGDDPSVFVNDIWKARIDKEWREALSRETMLGKAEYGELDKLVSELHQEKIDLKFGLYVLIVIAAVVGGWWFFVRRPKSAAGQQSK